MLMGAVMILDPVVGAQRDRRLVTPATEVVHVDRTAAAPKARVAGGLDAWS